MPDYDTQESSVESSRPIELYEFVKGTVYYRYTSAEDTITIGSDDYGPVAIARNEIRQGSNADTRTLTVTLPTTTELAQEFISVPPGEVITLNLFRYQRDETPSFSTQILIFKGVVKSATFDGEGTIAQLSLRSIESAMDTNMPRIRFMGACNNILGDDNCKVDLSLFNHLGTATDVTGNTVTISGASASGFDFVGGYVRPTGSTDFRLIIAQSGDVLTLLLPFQNNPLSLTMQVFAGCDHQIAGDCALTFDNVAEFLGFAFVPSRDIFRSGVRA